MPSLFDPAARAGILARVDRLTPASRRQWGQMSIGQMVVHVSAQLRLALGELPCEPRSTPFKNPLVKRLIIYLLPWPRGTPTAPELLEGTPAAALDQDLKALRTLIDRFGARGPGGEFPEHPAFGKLTGRLWGVLAWRHLDHHLRQFGV